MRVQLMFTLLLLAVVVYGDDPPVVTTSQGRIIGSRIPFRPPNHPELHRDVDAFLGIPYAEVPTGPLRFKPPVAKSWSGELQATEIGNRCPQPRLPVGGAYIDGTFSEDCLVLNILVPQPVPSKAAVLVYVHGGAFVIGAGIIMGYYPTATATVGDVIVVTVNYRLGNLGFMSTNDDVIPGNFGLLDQQFAFKWVKDNIAHFGGDPERVTILGESAGSISVALHMLSPSSAGLFKGAIMESGDASASWFITPGVAARQQAFQLGKRLGCEQETSEGLLACLQKVDYNSFVEKQLEWMGDTPPESYLPVVDGRFLPDDPNILLAKGATNNAASIIGATANEGNMMILNMLPNNTEVAPFINSTLYDALLPMYLAMVSTEPIVAEAAKLMYRDASCKISEKCDYLEDLSQICGDSMFICHGEKSAKAYTRAGLQVYRYHMTHSPTTSVLGGKWTKANHGDDLIFVFGMPLAPPDSFHFNEEEEGMAIRVIQYWANFVKTGNPNLSSLDAELTDEEKETEWPLFSLEELAYKELSLDMPNGRGIKVKECIFWNELVPKLVKISEEAKKCAEEAESSNKWTEDGVYQDLAGTCTDDKCPGE